MCGLMLGGLMNLPRGQGRWRAEIDRWGQTVKTLASSVLMNLMNWVVGSHPRSEDEGNSAN